MVVTSVNTGGQKLHINMLPLRVCQINTREEKKDHSTSVTSLMTRIQNGGRGYGKWKSELFFYKLHIAHSSVLRLIRTERYD